MITLNYELCLTLWTPSSVEFMNETYSERGITKDRILKTWKSFSEVEKNIFFVDKIEFSDKKNYAIIRYTSDESVAEYGATALSELDLVEVDGKWFATQELQKHPIAEYDW